MGEVEELRKLPPEERIRKLKEMEEQRKSEIEEAEALMRDSVREITETKEKIPIRQVTASDIAQLMTVEEKRLFRTARFQSESQPEGAVEAARQEQTLEEMAEEEAKKTEGQQRKPIYGQALEEARKGIDYSAKMTTTGADARGKEGVAEIYSSKTVTGENEGPRNMYERQSVEERTSGMYGRKEERKREAWQI